MGSYRTSPSLVKLQPGFLSLRWKTCPWAEYSDDDRLLVIEPFIFNLSYMQISKCSKQITFFF